MPKPPAATWLRARLLAWYDRHRRDLPWRAPPGHAADPYGVWLSEIMLQQTTVAAVIPYYQVFRQSWPDVTALARADLDQVLGRWQGLGYYARARNLHACARVVAEDHGGRFPDQEAALRALPGIGAYTAAAIAAICFDRPTVPVDGNVVRVLSRLHAIEAPPPAGPRRVRSLADGLAGSRPGDLAQALMDLGATVCRPRSPDCPACPVAERCQALAGGQAERFPVKAAKKPRPTRQGWVYWLENDKGELWLRRRPERGLLGGMMEFPSTDWRETPPTLDQAVGQAPVRAQWMPRNREISHVFTHFELRLRILSARAEDGHLPDGGWHHPDDFPGLALPSLMKKVVRAMGGG